jgi:ATP-dependent Clp endopeptidase proteolytic subunit ClpP
MKQKTDNSTSNTKADHNNDISDYSGDEVEKKLQKGILVNDFTESSVKSFKDDFDEFNFSKAYPYIPIYIDSFGGEIYSLLAMLDIIESAQKPVVTIAIGKAMSCGACLLVLGGTIGYRFATKHSTIMHHTGSGVSWGKLHELKSYAAELERLELLILSMMDEKCNKPSGFFANYARDKDQADIYFTANEAKELGLIDMVGYPLFIPKTEIEMMIPQNTMNIKKQKETIAIKPKRKPTKPKK